MSGCLKCGRRGQTTFIASARGGLQVRCRCGHTWRPRKPVQRPHATEVAA